VAANAGLDECRQNPDGVNLIDGKIGHAERRWGPGELYVLKQVLMTHMICQRSSSAGHIPFPSLSLAKTLHRQLYDKYLKPQCYYRGTNITERQCFNKITKSVKSLLSSSERIPNFPSQCWFSPGGLAIFAEAAAGEEEPRPAFKG
jgi:hypothetical protein